MLHMVKVIWAKALLSVLLCLELGRKYYKMFWEVWVWRYTSPLHSERYPIIKPWASRIYTYKRWRKRSSGNRCSIHEQLYKCNWPSSTSRILRWGGSNSRAISYKFLHFFLSTAAIMESSVRHVGDLHSERPQASHFIHHGSAALTPRRRRTE